MTNTSSNDDVRRMIILDRGTDSELGIVGLGYSPDNGEHFYVTNTIKGRVFRARDVDMIWPLLVDKIKSVMSVSWDQIQGKPTLVTKAELDQRLAKLNIPITMSWGQITDKPDLALKKDIPNVDGLVKDADLTSVRTTVDRALSNAEKAQSTADANTKKFDDYVMNVDYQDTLSNFKNAVLGALEEKADKDELPSIDTSSVNVNKQPSDYEDGFS